MNDQCFKRERFNMNRSILMLLIAVVAVGGFYVYNSSTDKEMVATDEPLKVGFVYLTNPGDHGWTYAHEVGRQQLQDPFGDKVETTYVANVPAGPDAARVIRALV